MCCAFINLPNAELHRAVGPFFSVGEACRACAHAGPAPLSFLTTVEPLLAGASGSSVLSCASTFCLLVRDKSAPTGPCLVLTRSCQVPSLDVINLNASFCRVFANHQRLNRSAHPLHESRSFFLRLNLHNQHLRAYIWVTRSSLGTSGWYGWRRPSSHPIWPTKLSNANAKSFYHQSSTAGVLPAWRSLRATPTADHAG